MRTSLWSHSDDFKVQPVFFTVRLLCLSCIFSSVDATPNHVDYAIQQSTWSALVLDWPIFSSARYIRTDNNTIGFWLRMSFTLRSRSASVVVHPSQFLSRHVCQPCFPLPTCRRYRREGCTMMADAGQGLAMAEVAGYSRGSVTHVLPDATACSLYDVK